MAAGRGITERVGVGIRDTGVRVFSGRPQVLTRAQELELAIGEASHQALWANDVPLKVQGESPTNISSKSSERRRRIFPVPSITRRVRKPSKSRKNGWDFDELFAA